MIAERFELLETTAFRTVPITLRKVLRPEFAVRDAVAHHVVRDFEDLMSDREDRFLLTRMARHAPVARLERRIPGPRGGQSRFDEGGFEIPIAFPCLALSAVAEPCFC